MTARLTFMVLRWTLSQLQTLFRKYNLSSCSFFISSTFISPYPYPSLPHQPSAWPSSLHPQFFSVPLFLPLGSSLFTILCLLYPLSFLCTRPNDLNLASAPLSPNHSTWGILVMYSLVIRSIRVMLSKILAPSDPLPGPLSDILLVPLFSNHT